MKVATDLEFAYSLKACRTQPEAGNCPHFFSSLQDYITLKFQANALKNVKAFYDRYTWVPCATL